MGDPDTPDQRHVTPDADLEPIDYPTLSTGPRYSERVRFTRDFRAAIGIRPIGMPTRTQFNNRIIITRAAGVIRRPCATVLTERQFFLW